MTAEFFDVKVTQSQVSVSAEKLCSSLESSSPILNEPKNAMQQAPQNTLLLVSDQLLLAISCPSIFNKGNNITSLACFVRLV